jgi:tRNA dimethylallyltransferase
MESKPNNTPLIVIVGETASGKTALGIELAKRFNGEIIAADSRTVYRGLSIGTAKPTIQEMDGVQHHLLDVVDPDEHFSAADFKRLANKGMADIAGRGRLPIMVGGTGLYVDSIIYDFAFRPAPNPGLRAKLEKLSVEELQDIISARGLPLPENPKNPRHLIRVIETDGRREVQNTLRENTLIIGLSIDREVLKEKLAKRVDVMVEAGLIDELQRAAKQFGWDAPALQATGYKAFRQYIAGEVTLEKAKTLFVRNDLMLAKRQRTWFRRNKSIHWICKKEEAVDLITTFLNKVSTAK